MPSFPPYPLVALLLAASPGMAADPPHPLPLDPGSWVTGEDYPDDAIIAGEQGAVFFRVEVDPQGTVSKCSVTESSGSTILDEATCKLLTERARFVPAKDKSGKAVASTYQSRFRWVLPEPVPRLEAGLIVTRIDLGQDGSLRSCSAEMTGTLPTSLPEVECANAPLMLELPALRAQRQRFVTLRVALSISVNGRKYPIEGATWGRLLYRRAGEIHHDRHGRAIGCVPLHAVGAGFCESLPPGLEIVHDPAATSVLKTTIDFAIYGVPREPGTPL